MTQTETSDQEQPNNRPNFPVRDAVNAQQVGTCLAIIGALQPYILLTQREFDKGVEKDFPDGGVPIASVTTFCRACDRLDRIIADDSRWGTVEIDQIYESSLKTQESMVKLNAEQMKHLAELNRPSRSLQPSFTKTDTGLTVCYWGDPSVVGGLIVGKGNTPAEALIDFDSAFNRHTSQQTRFNADALAKLAATMPTEQPAAVEEEELPPPTRLQRIRAWFRK